MGTSKFKTKGTLSALACLSLSACAVEKAGKNLLDDDIPSIHRTHVYIGKCMFSDDGESFLAGLAGKLASSVISNGADAVGTALSNAAKRNTSTSAVSQPFEIGTDTFPDCIQVVRGNFALKSLQQSQITALWADESKHFAKKASKLQSHGMHLTKKPDFFLEAKFRASSANANAVTLYPAFAAYNVPLENVPLGTSARNIKVTFNFHAPGAADNAKGAVKAVLDLGEMKVGQSAEFGGVRVDYLGNSGAENTLSRANNSSEDAPRAGKPSTVNPRGVPFPGQSGASTNGANQAAVATTGATDSTTVARLDKYLFESNWMTFALSSKPALKTVTVNVEEIKDAEPGLTFAGQVFGEVKEDLKTKLEIQLIEDKAKEAELTALKTQNTNTATAATSFSEAFTKLTACSTSGTVSNAAVAFAAQNKANLDALTAGQTPPFASDDIITLSVKTSTNAAQCNAALAALGE